MHLPLSFMAAYTLLSIIRWLARIDIGDPNVWEGCRKQERKNKELSPTPWMWQSPLINTFNDFSEFLKSSGTPFSITWWPFCWKSWKSKHKRHKGNMWGNTKKRPNMDNREIYANCTNFPWLETGLVCRKTCPKTIPTGERLIYAHMRQVCGDVATIIVNFVLEWLIELPKKLGSSSPELAL